LRWFWEGRCEDDESMMGGRVGWSRALEREPKLAQPRLLNKGRQASAQEPSSQKWLYWAKFILRVDKPSLLTQSLYMFVAEKDGKKMLSANLEMMAVQLAKQIVSDW
jgi:hypothetical protein